MHIVQSQSNLFQNFLSRLYRKRWIIIHQRKQIAFEVLINKYVHLPIEVDVVSKMRVVTKLIFKLLQVIKY